MTSPLLDLHINQFFAFAALIKADRYDDARPAFTYRTADLILSVFAEACDALDRVVEEEHSPELLRFAQVFERFSSIDLPGVSRPSAARTAAAFYWLGGFAANALVLARSSTGSESVEGDRRRAVRFSKLTEMLTAILARRVFGAPSAHSEIASYLQRYLMTGSAYCLSSARQLIAQRTRSAFAAGDSTEYTAGVLLDAVLRRLSRVSLWGSLAGHTSTPLSVWRHYATTQAQLETPLIDLWPSQRRAIEKGLLNGGASLVLRMPTSAGKTKLTELTFVNDLATHTGRCLYLAPFRSLVSDVETSLAPPLVALGYPVATLYGSSDANELEVELSEQARVVIATPEKIGAVTRLSGTSLADFDTIVIDEGHLLGSTSRGAAFELQLANVRAAIGDRLAVGSKAPRIVFLSAVLPNADEIALWLTGSPEAVADSEWHPTAMRVGILTWGKNRYARVDYLAPASGEAGSAYFVPRLFGQDSWQERHPSTRRNRTYEFPDRTKKASVAAALVFQAARNGSVLVYAQQPRWVDSVADAIIDRCGRTRPIDTGLVSDSNRASIAELATFVTSRLGADSRVSRALTRGVGIHHSGVPQGIRLVLEDAFRRQTIKLLVATSTVSQGVNFPARTVVIHSLPRGEAPIRDFWNLAGRAGRAMRETEGDVIVLRSESSTPKSMDAFLAEPEQRSLRECLDKAKTEPAQSQILELVRALYEAGGVTDATLDALLALPRQHDAVDWSKCVAAIDTDLLERLVEDAEGADAAAIDRLLPHLLATTQASRAKELEQFTEQVRTLLNVRARAVRQAVPAASTRQRYARTGLTADNAIALDTHCEALRAYLLTAPELDLDSLSVVMSIACAAPALATVDAGLLARTTMTWLSTGHYEDVRRADPVRFATVDAAIEHVEETIGYKLTWVLSGLLRLMDDTLHADDAERRAELPEWFRLLPQYVRYGVASRDLLWIMTLGIQDRTHAEQILTELVGERDQFAGQFRSFVRLLVESEERLIGMASRTNWSTYFVAQLRDVIARYRRLLG